MILTCLSCQTRYIVAADLFAAGPRQVRCSHCHHIWQAELPHDVNDALKALSPDPAQKAVPNPQSPPQPALPGMLLAQPADTPPPDPKPPMSTRIRLLWKIGKTGSSIFAAVLLLLWLVMDRQEIAQNRPRLEKIYDSLGLNIYHYGGEGLSFEKVRSELRFDSGIMTLVVEGKIHNETEFVQEMPDMLATAIGSDGQVLQSWQIDAPALRVLDGEVVPFHSSITAPRETVVNVNLSFIEIKNADERIHKP